MRNIFKRKKPQKSYSELKRELEIRARIYGKMTSLSDAQMDHWVRIEIELQDLESKNRTAEKVVRLKTN